MRTPGPFPYTLRAGPFTVADARRVGVSRQRLRSRDVERVRHGVYRWVGGPGPELQTGAAPGDLVLTSLRPARAAREGGLAPDDVIALRALAATCPGLAVTGATAARLWGWPEVPATRATRHEVLRPRTGKQPSGSGHRTRRHRPDAVRTVADETLGLRLTTVDETWFHLARRASLEDLVVLGDVLVRTHRPESGPPWRWSSLEELRACVDRHAGRHGVRQARRALDLVRDGADSPPETRLRLALLEAGLPEPELQIEVWDPAFSPRRPATADLGYRGARLALHYDGVHHGGERQIDSDVQRNAAFERRGYRNVVVSATDGRRGFGRVITAVREHLDAHGGATPAVMAPKRPF